MKVCKNCGAHLEDSAAYCPLCGAEQEPPYAQNNQQSQSYARDYEQGYNQYGSQNPQQYYQPNNSQYNYGAPYERQSDPRYTNLQNEISTVRTLGIVSIIGLFFAGIVTLVCSIIGIIKGNEAIAQAQLLGDPLLIKQAQDAKKLNKVPLIILIVLVVLAVIAVALLATVGGGFSNYSYGY